MAWKELAGETQNRARASTNSEDSEGPGLSLLLSSLVFGDTAISRNSGVTVLQQVELTSTGSSLNREQQKQVGFHPFDSSSKDISVEIRWTEATALEISKLVILLW